MSATDLAAVAQAMVARGRGVLAADESNATITKRFAALGIESTEENRRAYRDTLLSTPGIEEYISGVILYDETIRQSSADGTAFPEMLKTKGILPGIKVDTGSKPLANNNDEQVTEGLDGLRERIAEYVEPGRQVRQVAGRDHHRRGARLPVGLRHPLQRPRTGPLRRPVPGGWPGADHRARGADGRHQRHRRLLRGGPSGPSAGCSRS